MYSILLFAAAWLVVMALIALICVIVGYVFKSRSKTTLESKALSEAVAEETTDNNTASKDQGEQK